MKARQSSPEKSIQLFPNDIAILLSRSLGCLTVPRLALDRGELNVKCPSKARRPVNVFDANRNDVSDRSHCLPTMCQRIVRE